MPFLYILCVFSWAAIRILCKYDAIQVSDNMQLWYILVYAMKHYQLINMLIYMYNIQ
jgi:hypothetical protein